MTKAVSAPFDCTRCGHVHQRGCTGHVDAPGEDLRPCKNAPIKGANVCRYHGGAAGQVKASARRRLARAEAAASLSDIEVVPLGDPLDALAELAAEAWAWKGHLADMVAQLREQYRFTDEKDSEQLDARVALFERSMDRCQKFLSDWVRLGFEERKVRVDEIRAGLMAVVLTGVLRDLGHDPEAETVLGVLDRWLPVLDGKPAPIIDINEEGP